SKAKPRQQQRSSTRSLSERHDTTRTCSARHCYCDRTERRAFGLTAIATFGDATRARQQIAPEPTVATCLSAYG
ncbi:hypothetical protein QTI66_38745, partial [Variovorax sp. J22R133]|uniref:hypothetical protein n=1 Tax=Variovorax brevis TaxID=3053503 RepID=UPI0025749C1D